MLTRQLPYSRENKQCLFRTHTVFGHAYFRKKSRNAYVQSMLILRKCKRCKKICKKKLTPHNILASKVLKTVDIGKLLVLSEPWTEKDY